MHTPSFHLLIARTLRWGVTLACLVAALGGGIYLVQHGAEPMPDYTRFTYDTAAQHHDYTTLRGIVEGVAALRATSWVQLGVLILILTPIVRVLLSLVEYVQERDWTYALITSIVLAVILLNSLGGA